MQNPKTGLNWRREVFNFCYARHLAAKGPGSLFSVRTMSIKIHIVLSFPSELTIFLLGG